MTDAIAAALAAGLSAPETELQPWEALPGAERERVQGAIATTKLPRYLVAPKTQAGLAAAMTVATNKGLRVLPYGRGTKLDWGGTCQAIDLLVSTRNLAQIVEHAVGDLTLTVEAGATLADIQQHLAACGQFLPLDPAFPATATIGGILATADAGSWRQRYGGVRDLVLGISIVRADGQVAKAGGRVVKNVAGYDLMKLFAGSYGTLGTIAQVTLRTYACAEASATVWAMGSAEAIAAVALQLRSSALTPVAADLLNPVGLSAAGGNYSLVARFQGTSAGVEEQLDRFEAIAAQQDLKASICRNGDEDDLWQQIQEIARPPITATNPVTSKFGLQPTAAIALLAKLNQFNAPGLVHLGSGVGRLAIAADSARVGEMREFCQRHSGYLTVLAASQAFKAQIEPWGYIGNATEMMRRLKQKFDPQNLLSPGCFVGGL